MTVPLYREESLPSEEAAWEVEESWEKVKVRKWV